MLQKAYRLRFTEVPSVKGCYEEKLTTEKHDGFSVPIGAMEIGLLP